MRILAIKKKSGGVRFVAAPSNNEKDKLRAKLPLLNDRQLKVCAPCVHGFLPGRSPVTNAKEHIGYRYTLSFDLSNFFDTVSESHIGNRLSLSDKEAFFVDGKAMQGLPTSPAVANIAAIDMDTAILKFCKKLGNVKYTRYADDMTFSFNEYELVNIIKLKLKEAVGRHKFTLNEKKTRLQDSRYGLRVVTGVGVSEFSIKSTKKSRKKLRASEHQRNKFEANGHREWCSLKMPSIRNTFVDEKESAKKLAFFLGLKNVKWDSVRSKKHDEYKNGLVITGDPSIIIGMSYFGDGWRSCMHPDGSKFSGIAQYMYLSGVRVAYVKSNKTVNVSGREFHLMKSRAIIFKLENGKEFYGRIYGFEQDEMRSLLESIGIMHVCTIQVKQYVAGYGVESQKRPYLDFGNFEVVNGKLRVAL